MTSSSSGLFYVFMGINFSVVGNSLSFFCSVVLVLVVSSLFGACAVVFLGILLSGCHTHFINCFEINKILFLIKKIF